MDKRQKELVDTYFRKRKIATSQNGFGPDEDYELDYLLRTNAIDPATIKASNMIFVFQHYPQLVDKLNLDVFKVHSRYYLTYILGHMPQYFDLLNSKLNLKYILYDSDVEDILLINPQVVEKLNLKSIVGDELVNVLNINSNLTKELLPNLKTLTANNLSMLNDDAIFSLLFYAPQFITLLDLRKLPPRYIEVLLNARPLLKPYFDKLNSNG